MRTVSVSQRTRAGKRNNKALIEEMDLRCMAHSLSRRIVGARSPRPYTLRRPASGTLPRRRGRCYSPGLPSPPLRGERQDAARNSPCRFSCLGAAGCPAAQFRRCMEKRGQHHSKPDIPVTVVRIVPVAHGAAHIVLIVVERAPTQHPSVCSGLPPQHRPRRPRVASIVIPEYRL